MPQLTEKSYLWGEVRKLLPFKSRFALYPQNEMSAILRARIEEENEKIGTLAQVCEFVEVGNIDYTKPGENQLNGISDWNPEVIVVCDDGNKLSILLELNRIKWGHFPHVVIPGVGHHENIRNKVLSLEAAIGEESHAVGYHYLKAHFYELLRSCRDQNIVGDIVELGVFRGGTLLLLNQILKDLQFQGPKLIGFDTWSGFPERRSLLDMYSSEEYVCKKYEEINGRLAQEGIELIRGDIIDTIGTIASRSLILTFIDTDNYTPAKAALPLIAERTQRGGAIVFDHYYALEEYNDALGDGIAAMEFFAESSKCFLNLSGTGVFIKM